jgi:hypothetical protein
LIVKDYEREWSSPYLLRIYCALNLPEAFTHLRSIKSGMARHNRAHSEEDPLPEALVKSRGVFRVVLEIFQFFGCKEGDDLTYIVLSILPE